MRSTEVARLLLFTHALDQRHDTDDIRVQAWTATLDQEAPAMEYRWAQAAVSAHYAKDSAMLTLEHLIRGWKAHARTRMDAAALESHCGRAGCSCTHSCYKGWRDLADGTAAPCLVCRPQLAEILGDMPLPGLRTAVDFTRLQVSR